MKKKAFTLIELLVVIAIIGILATLAVIALQRARANARDAKRVADVKQISTALEMYFNDNQLYPETLEELQTEGYMEQLPEAPTPADEGCEPGENEYNYTVDDERGDYEVSFCTGKQVSDMSPGILCMTPGGISTNCGEATSGTFVDVRDGQEYEWVEIGGQTWMAENLKYDNGCTSVTWVNSSDEGWCGYYSEDETTYGDYGMLYQLSAAMNGTTTEGAQGICPDGWHLPTDAEWDVLISYLGVNPADQLKASSSDTPVSWEGNNSSGFTALPAGLRLGDGGFYLLGDRAYSWSSSILSGTGYSWYRSLWPGDSDVSRDDGNPASGFSVRCLQD